MTSSLIEIRENSIINMEKRESKMVEVEEAWMISSVCSREEEVVDKQRNNK